MKNFKKNALLILCLNLILVLVMAARASAGSAENSVLPSVEWQKMNLQEKISNKINKGLGAIIKSNQYIVDVEIITKSPGMPNFTSSEAPPKRVRFQEDQSSKPGQDYIVFSKIGLEAPTIGEFEPPKNERSDLYYLWKYNQSLDIFQNLENVNIEIFLSDRLTEETRKAVAQMISSMKFNLGDIKPDIKTTFINMDEKMNPDPTLKPEPKPEAKAPEKKPEPPKPAKEEKKEIKPVLDPRIEALARFANMIGLIVATLLIGTFAFVIFKKYEKLENSKSPARSSAPAAAEGGAGHDKKDSSHGTAAVSGLAAGEAMEGQYSGFERFKMFLEKSPQDAGVLVKRWLKSDEAIASNALVALVQQLETKDLMRIFEVTSVEEREKWKELIASTGQITDLSPIKDFISKQIVEEIMVPAVIADRDVCDALMTLKDDDAARFISEQKELGGILMNVMSTKYISKVLEKLSLEEAEEAIERSLSFDKSDLESLLPAFKEKLLSYQGKQSHNPFVKKMVELIAMASPSREKSLIKRLAQMGEYETIKRVAHEHFPSELVTELPSAFIEVVFRSMSLHDKTELLISMTNEELKDQFIEAFAPKGSSARDMIELEFEKYHDDAALMKKVSDKSEEIWSKFIAFTRSKVRSEKSFGPEIDVIINSWLEDLKKDSAKVSPIQIADAA